MKLIRVKCKDHKKIDKDSWNVVNKEFVWNYKKFDEGIQKLLAYTKNIAKKHSKEIEVENRRDRWYKGGGTIAVKMPEDGLWYTIVSMYPTFNYYGSEKNFLPDELSKAKKFVDGELKKLFQGKSLTGWKLVNGEFVWVGK